METIEIDVDESESKVKKEKDCKNGKAEEKKPKVKVEKDPKVKVEKNGVQVKKEKEETIEKEYFVFINGQKTRVRVVQDDESEEKKEKEEELSDTSVKEKKQPKILKPLYTVSSSDEDTSKDRLKQLDGNGSSVEECGEKISIPPPSIPGSFVTYSDTTESTVMNKTIGECLSEIYGPQLDSNADSDADTCDSNAHETGKIGSVFDGYYYCSECPAKLLTSEGLRVHYKHAHISGTSDTEYSEGVMVIDSSSS